MFILKCAKLQKGKQNNPNKDYNFLNIMTI
jgi:hypothetical protein